MAMTSVASNTVIDLSGDNDNAGALAALNNLPRLNSSSGETSFERSCDNPECSAPKLISHVAKLETSEFITEPMILNQPTLINGFTTVFQIDGVATSIDEMNESTAAVGTAQDVNTNKPKTVFRVVPNTHAHIVNYVVVDGAGDTMRKIKVNDAETMRKLLFSQRLSAEQMLKKLIGKALETPTRQQKPNTTPGPVPVPAPASVPVPAPATVPVSAPVLLPVSKPVYKQVSKPVSNPISKPVYKPVCKPVSKPVPTNKEVLSIVPSGITVKIVPSPESKQTASKPSTIAAINSTINKPIQKPFSSLTTKAITNTQQPNAATQSTPKLLTGAGSSANLASKPVVWQAIPSGTASKTIQTSINTTSPKASSSTSSGINQPAVISPVRLASSSIATSSSQQETPKLPTTNETDREPFDIENAISSASIATRRTQVESPGVTQQQPRILKRKQELTTPVQEVIKRLRPRSPTRKQNVTPLAFNLSKATDSPQPVKKLLTLNPSNKLPTRPAEQQKPVLSKVQPTPVEEMLIDTKDEVDTNEEDEIITPDTAPLSASNSNKKDTHASQEAVEQSQPKKIDTQPVLRKSKPLMGPASKMKALKAMAEEKAMAMIPKNDAPNRCKSALLSDSGPMKIGETIITRTGSLKCKENPPPPLLTPSQPPPTPENLTRPCSVAVTDIAKISTTTDSDSDSKSTRSTPRTRRTADKEALLSKEPYVKAKAVESLMAKLRTRWTIGKEDETLNAGKSDSPKLGRSTRSTIQKVAVETAQTTEATKSAADELSDPTLLTTPSAPSRVMRVVLPPPSTKNDSPHPNLKISSIISGDTALAATLGEADSQTATAATDDNSSGSDIEKLQKELADLRRTVARLTHAKTT